MKTFRRLSAALLAATFAIGVPAAANAGTIKLGMTTWVGYGPLFLARDLGYFKDEGVDVQLNIIEDAALYMAGVASGDLDGSASTVDELMKYRSNELCFKYVVTLDDSHGGDGVLAKDDVNSLKDLKGQEIGMNQGSTSEFWFNMLLRKEGMTEDDVKITNMTADDAAAAFIAGQIPAAVTWEPHLTLVKTQKKGKVLIDSASTPGAIVDVVELSCKMIEKNPKDVMGLVKGLYKANEFIKSDPQKAYEIMAKGVGGYLSKPEDFAASAKGVTFYDKQKNIEFWGTAEKGPLKDLIALGNDILGKAGKLKQPGSYEELVDSTFIKGE